MTTASSSSPALLPPPLVLHSPSLLLPLILLFGFIGASDVVPPATLHPHVNDLRFAFLVRDGATDDSRVLRRSPAANPYPLSSSLLPIPFPPRSSASNPQLTSKIRATIYSCEWFSLRLLSWEWWRAESSNSCWKRIRRRSLSRRRRSMWDICPLLRQSSGGWCMRSMRAYVCGSVPCIECVGEGGWPWGSRRRGGEIGGDGFPCLRVEIGTFNGGRRDRGWWCWESTREGQQTAG